MLLLCSRNTHLFLTCTEDYVTVRECTAENKNKKLLTNKQALSFEHPTRISHLHLGQSGYHSSHWQKTLTGTALAIINAIYRWGRAYRILRMSFALNGQRIKCWDHTKVQYLNCYYGSKRSWDLYLCHWKTNWGYSGLENKQIAKCVKKYFCIFICWKFRHTECFQIIRVNGSGTNNLQTHCPEHLPLPDGS